jgi:hypothetical protein
MGGLSVIGLSTLIKHNNLKYVCKVVTKTCLQHVATQRISTEIGRDKTKPTQVSPANIFHATHNREI